ncbi:hypothetical protein HYFRA_00001660 [Hymenoscyphus fraxineus]|uniref:Lipocalin-like domain-containing protein n=1 Tax=Hymenoscyphus fraxineus TaxID=746836 RepID=A0A9N9L611_9HELO|nr:hypothetical protein HYFRA_00001660 [Hymenoscyphus fraxineus]
MHIPYEKVIGVWNMLYFNNTEPCTGWCLPLPPTAKDLGTITITPSRYFSAVITRTDLAVLPPNETWRTINDSVRGQIAWKFVTYSGPISLAWENDSLVSTVDVEVSLTPEWIGSKQKRGVTFKESEGETLMILNPFRDDGPSRTFLYWQRKEGF